MIRITHFNEVFSNVETDTHTKHKLMRLFHIEEPGHYFNPMYKLGAWDGRRNLYNGGNLIHSGLIPFIKNYCKKSKIEFEDETKLFPRNTKHREDLSDFIKELKLPFEPREYQLNAVKECIYYKKLAICSPTSSGKSFIIYMLTRYMQNHKRGNNKLLIIVPSKILVKQMYDDFADYSKNSDWNVKENCSRISSDFNKDFNKDIIITTYQSIANEDIEFFKNFEGVILDECHGAQSYNNEKAKRLHVILNQCINSRYRFGFTGTFPDEMLYRLTLLKYFCNKYDATDYHELLENNWISKFTLNAVKLHYLVNKNGQVYRDELNYIYESEYRNDFLKKLLLKNKNNQLMLFKEITKHALKFYNELKSDPRFEGKQIVLLSGESKVKERDFAKKLIAENDNVILLATYKLLGTGWSVNNLHHIIFAAPLKSKQPILQSIGRGLRLLNSDKNCQIWDIVDRFLYSNILYRQWKEREQHYKSVNFKINRIDIDDYNLVTKKQNKKELEEAIKSLFE